MIDLKLEAEAEAVAKAERCNGRVVSAAISLWKLADCSMEGDNGVNICWCKHRPLLARVSYSPVVSVGRQRFWQPQQAIICWPAERIAEAGRRRFRAEDC